MSAIRWNFWLLPAEVRALQADAEEARLRIEHVVVPTHREAVSRVLQIKRENHLGQTFKRAYRGKAV